MLIDSTRSETKKRIINCLLSRNKTLKELSEELKISKQALLKHLKELETSNLIKSNTKKPNGYLEKEYSLKSFSTILSVNKKGYAIQFISDSPLNTTYPLINQIPQKEFREQVLIYLKKISNIKKSFSLVVFGSVARGEAVWKSDIDVALFSDKWPRKEKDRFMNKISDVKLNKKVDVPLNPHFMKYEDLEKEGIFRDILEEGILIYSSGKEKLWKKLKRYQSI